MLKKKSIMDRPGCREKFYPTDNLTPLGAKLLKYVKGLESLDKAWSTDGKVCINTHQTFSWHAESVCGYTHLLHTYIHMHTHIILITNTLTHTNRVCKDGWVCWLNVW